MADNVVKFRKIEKKPEKPPQKPRTPGQPPKWSAWLPWAVIGGIAVVFFLVQSMGLLGG